MVKDKDLSKMRLTEGPLRYTYPLQQVDHSQLLDINTSGTVYSCLVSHMLFYLQLGFKDRDNAEGFRLFTPQV